MRRLVLALLMAAAGAAWPVRPLAQSRAPKLAVLLVVDQMRADYVDRFQKDWTGGLKRLVTEGAVFEHAAYPYLSTVTCAGHATISTGTFPHSHGVILNGWWDRERGATVTCTQDPNVKGIGYDVTFEAGDSAWRLQRPTFTDVMRRQKRARVATLALKDRSAIMLAGHGGDAVTWFNDSIDGWATSTAFSSAAVPAVGQYIAAHPVKGDFGKTWTRLLPPSRYGYPDDQPQEAPSPGWTRTFPHVLNGENGIANASYFTQWERTPYADAYVVKLASSLVDALGLGRHDGVDVLGVSFSTPDMIGHAFGPRSQEIQDIYAHLDRTLGELFNHLDDTVGRGQWVAALSADHGVTPMPEQLVAEGRDGGRLTAGMLVNVIQERLRGEFGTSPLVAQAGGNDLYFAPGVYQKLRASPKSLDAVVRGLQEVPGVARVFRGEELANASASKDPLQRAAALSYFPGRSGDLTLALKPGWIFSATGTNHGSANPDDQRVPVIFLGAGVKPGRYNDAASPADVAPTLAALAGASMPNVEGRVQSAVLNPQTTAAR